MIGTVMLKASLSWHRQTLSRWPRCLASLAPAVGHAKDGKDDGDSSSHSVAVAAASCT